MLGVPLDDKASAGLAEPAPQLTPLPAPAAPAGKPSGGAPTAASAATGAGCVSGELECKACLPFSPCPALCCP